MAASTTPLFRLSSTSPAVSILFYSSPDGSKTTPKSIFVLAASSSTTACAGAYKNIDGSISTLLLREERGVSVQLTAESTTSRIAAERSSNLTATLQNISLI